jgi:hypothetical protein
MGQYPTVERGGAPHPVGVVGVHPIEAWRLTA